MRSAVQFWLKNILIAGAILAAFYSFLLARASWLFEQDTASSIAKAAGLLPYNGAYLARLAAWRPAQKLTLLGRAVELNPFDFESLIQLGVSSEFQKHDDAQAERYYLQAATVNKMFLPKWTLTNFYFRHGRTAEFFRWATASLAITPYSPEPIFLQMWLMSQDGTKIARAMPDRPRILLPYAWFLSNNQRTGTIASVVRHLIGVTGKMDPRAWGRDDLVAMIEDRLLAQGDGNSALAIWSSMAKAGWIQDDVPSPSHPVTNGKFQRPFYEHGFDWIPLNARGVRIDQIASEGLLRLQFSGEEPERCSILEQYIPLEANRMYNLRWRLQAALAEEPSGLSWRISPVKQGVPGEMVSGDLGTTGAGEWKFRTSAASGISRLTLEYSRPLGHLRTRGTVLLKAVSSNPE